MALKGIRRHLQDKKDEEMQQMRERLLNEKIKREKDLVRLHYTLLFILNLSDNFSILLVISCYSTIVINVKLFISFLVALLNIMN